MSKIISIVQFNSCFLFAQYMDNTEGKVHLNSKKNMFGGEAVASGGYGCVFIPSLKCVGQSTRKVGHISKLMTDKHAHQEYEEILQLRGYLQNVPNYADYFLINSVSVCKPDKLSKSDLKHFNSNCSALPKDGITKKNINKRLHKVMALNLLNGGMPVDDYLYSHNQYHAFYKVHMSLAQLLKHGILPMNKRHVFHSDIKDSNVLVDDTKDANRNGIKTRLIDWGISVYYNPSNADGFPQNWRNRPLQFNVPFSNVLLSDMFVAKYTDYLAKGNKPIEQELKPFVIDFMHDWMKTRGIGHYKLINEIMYMLYEKELTTVATKQKPQYVENQITMPAIVDYLVAILVEYTVYENKRLSLKGYLNKVYVKIVDIYGFINIYFPFLEMLHNNYNTLEPAHLKLFHMLADLFKKWLYSPCIHPYNLGKLSAELKQIGKQMHIVSHKRVPNTKSMKWSSINSKTRTQKRKLRVKHFQRPILF